MDDDQLPQALGEIMREQDRAQDPRLDRLARGEISDTERAELEAAAASDPALAAALALYAPLSPEVRGRLVETARRSARPPARLFTLPRLSGMAALAAAAVVAALALLPGAPPLPSYALHARAGDAEWRGAEAPRSHAVRADSEIQLVLQPDHPVESTIEARLFVIAGGTSARSPASFEISRDGAVRWRGRADAIAPGRSGPVTLVAVVGRAGHLPDEAPSATHTGEAWQSMSLRVEIRPAIETP